ncbi:TRAP transporter small permease subunit [Roseibium sp.]|uniref:TRAP transporter small permease n=1 Tax=Roseibium sp. TaxID=1936156 RepID=UPI0032664C56
MRAWAVHTSAKLNTAAEAVIVVLMALLVLDVWLGVVDRYYFHWQLPWPEIVARYLMIWAALLAVSSGIARRDHIGLTAVIMRVPVPLRRAVLIAVDLCVLALFLYVFWYGLGFAASGASRQAMIFGVSLQPFYAAIPAAAALASVQTVLAMIRDAGTHLDAPPFAETSA